MKQKTLKGKLLFEEEKTGEHDKLLEKFSKIDKIQELIDCYFKIKEFDFEIQKIEIEKPLFNHNNPIGFIDIFVTIKSKLKSDSYWEAKKDLILIEIKPTVKNLGNLIRQIKFYMAIIKNDWKYRSDHVYPFIITYSNFSNEMFHNEGIRIICLKKTK